jgi:hypothetical protein
MERMTNKTSLSGRLSRWLAPFALAAVACAAPTSGDQPFAAGYHQDSGALIVGGASMIVLGCVGRRSRKFSVQGRTPAP